MGGTDGCCGLASPADQVLCIAAVQCFSTSNCTVGGDATRCFCGTIQSSNCFAVPGAANGACVAEVVAANKSNDPGMIKAFLTSPAYRARPSRQPPRLPRLVLRQPSAASRTVFVYEADAVPAAQASAFALSPLVRRNRFGGVLAGTRAEFAMPDERRRSHALRRPYSE